METTSLQRSHAWLVLAAVLVVVGLGVWVVTASPFADTGTAPQDAAAAAPVGDSDRPPAPDVELPLRDGGSMTLDELEGRPVVVNFWASWCPPCVAEMGEALEPAHQQYGDRVEFLGVNLQDEPEAAQRIVEETGVTYELALDRDGQAFAAFGGVGMPTTIFIDEQGRIVEHHTGILTSEQLDAQIDRLLEA